MRALSIRQPYAELILRGIKPIEFRSGPTRIIDHRRTLLQLRQPALVSEQAAAGMPVAARRLRC